MNSLYARAWYSKALALLNLKNQIGSEKNFERALEVFNSMLEDRPVRINKTTEYFRISLFSSKKHGKA